MRGGVPMLFHGALLFSRTALMLLTSWGSSARFESLARRRESPRSEGRNGLGESADVVIVGAGVTGLALALALRQRNVSTLLLDARRSADAVPRGITLQPNGLDALDKLGVLGNVRKSGSEARIFEIRNPKGEVLLEADYGLLEHPQNYLLTVIVSELDLAVKRAAEQWGAQVVWGAGFKDIVRNNGQVQSVSFQTE